MSNVFEVAIRNKFRFPSTKGMLSVEDLWDINLKDLDSIFKTLNSQLKKVKEDSLLTTKSKEDKELDLKIEIVKYIFTVKQDEDTARLKAKENKEKKQKLMEILAKKQDQSLEGKSIEEIQAMLNELD